MTIRILLILAAVSFSASALAQDAAPNVGNKPLARVKPKEPMGCKLVGTVRGTKTASGRSFEAQRLRPRSNRRLSNPYLSEQAE
jgi:hypothetical protein